MAVPYWIGVDLGGTKILVGLFDDHFQVVARAKQNTNYEEGGPAVFSRIVTAVDEVLRTGKVEPSQVKGMTLAVPGQIVPRSTVVRYAPNLNWRDFDLAPLFPPRWTWPVVVENDVRMGTYGEWTQGAAKGAQHVFGLFAGTGVGGGLILNGQLYHGVNGHAGEIGHIIIGWKNGVELEAIAGRRNLMNRARQVIADSPKTVRKAWKGLDPTAFKSSEIAGCRGEERTDHVVPGRRGGPRHRRERRNGREPPESGSHRHRRRHDESSWPAVPRANLGDRPALRSARGRPRTSAASWPPSATTRGSPALPRTRRSDFRPEPSTECVSMNPEWKNRYEVMVEAARAAGELALGYFDRNIVVE